MHNQIVFYPVNPVLSQIDINAFSEYFLVASEPLAKPSKSHHIISVAQPQITYPTKKNTLFWSIYGSLNPSSDGSVVHSFTETCETVDIKEIVHKIRESPTWLKSSNHKLTFDTIKEIQSELFTNSNLKYGLYLIPFALFYEIRLIVVRHNTVVTIESDNSKRDVYLFYNELTEKFGYSPEIDVSNMFVIEQLAKPYKSCSAYKVEELRLDLTKLGIPYDKKSTKTALYVLLSLYFTKFGESTT